jgi:hypothetical protein
MAMNSVLPKAMSRFASFGITVVATSVGSSRGRRRVASVTPAAYRGLDVDVGSIEQPLRAVANIAQVHAYRMPDSPDIERGTYCDLVKLSDGKMKISLTDQGCRALDALERIRDQFGINAALREVLNDHIYNGWDEVYPEEIGALTSAMFLSDDVERDDSGRVIRIGRVYWNPCYAVSDEIQELRERSCLVLDGA